MTEEKLHELWYSGEYRRIGPARHTGYVPKGTSRIYPYFGRYGNGWMVEVHSNKDRRRHDTYYYVRRV